MNIKPRDRYTHCVKFDKFSNKRKNPLVIS